MCVDVCVCDLLPFPFPSCILMHSHRAVLTGVVLRRALTVAVKQLPGRQPLQLGRQARKERIGGRRNASIKLRKVTIKEAMRVAEEQRLPVMLEL